MGEDEDDDGEDIDEEDETERRVSWRRRSRKVENREAAEMP